MQEDSRRTLQSFVLTADGHVNRVRCMGESNVCACRRPSWHVSRAWLWCSMLGIVHAHAPSVLWRSWFQCIPLFIQHHSFESCQLQYFSVTSCPLPLHPNYDPNFGLSFVTNVMSSILCTVPTLVIPYCCVNCADHKDHGVFNFLFTTHWVYIYNLPPEFSPKDFLEERELSAQYFLAERGLPLWVPSILS